VSTFPAQLVVTGSYVHVIRRTVLRLLHSNKLSSVVSQQQAFIFEDKEIQLLRGDETQATYAHGEEHRWDYIAVSA
jgi:hypothetical protein